MGFLVVMLLIGLASGGVFAWRWWQREKVQRTRDRARLRAIESQMAAMRTLLRIGAAEHVARLRMRTEVWRCDPFANPTLHEEPETWRW